MGSRVGSWLGAGRHSPPPRQHFHQRFKPKHRFPSHVFKTTQNHTQRGRIGGGVRQDWDSVTWPEARASACRRAVCTVLTETLSTPGVSRGLGVPGFPACLSHDPPREPGRRGTGVDAKRPRTRLSPVTSGHARFCSTQSFGAPGPPLRLLCTPRVPFLTASLKLGPCHCCLPTPQREGREGQSKPSYGKQALQTSHPSGSSSVGEHGALFGHGRGWETQFAAGWFKLGYGKKGGWIWGGS